MNTKHVSVVRGGSRDIAAWREAHPGRIFDLRGANLSWADLVGADLSRADLSRADLNAANLNGANLSGAHLCRANLYAAYLGGARLSGADFYGANLYRANLRGVDLSGADFRGANLSGARLEPTRVLQLGPLGPHRVYLVVVRCPSWPEEEAQLGCERGTLASLRALAQERYGEKGDFYYRAFDFAEAFSRQ